MKMESRGNCKGCVRQDSRNTPIQSNSPTTNTFLNNIKVVVVELDEVKFDWDGMVLPNEEYCVDGEQQ
jgi:hypothetical protein